MPNYVTKIRSETPHKLRRSERKFTSIQVRFMFLGETVEVLNLLHSRCYKNLKICFIFCTFSKTLQWLSATDLYLNEVHKD